MIKIDDNESDMDCDDDELRVWKLLNTFISDPENNLQNKYINFQKLNEKLPNDKLHKTITTTANHFKNQCGLSAEEACKCTMNFLNPIFRDVLKKDNNDYFWDQFLQLPINENEIDNNDEENDNINNDYVNLVKYIEKAKIKLMKEYGINEIDGYIRAVQKKVDGFTKIADNLNQSDDESSEDDENIVKTF